MKGLMLIFILLLALLVGINRAQAYDPFRKYCDDSVYISKFRLTKLGLGNYVRQMHNCSSGEPFFKAIRNDNPENPGYYFQYPYGTIAGNDILAPSSEERDFIATLMPNYLLSKYYSTSLLDSIENRYLQEIKRMEFFFEADINNTRFRFSGWYGKFAHIFVFTDFDSKEGFIKKASQYINLPELDISKVSFNEDTDSPDYFYSYDDPNAEFKLVAYPFLKRKIKSGKAIYSTNGTILDLTVYPEEK